MNESIRSGSCKNNCISILYHSIRFYFAVYQHITIFVIAWLFFCGTCLQAQQSAAQKIDSLERVLAAGNMSEKELLECYYDLSCFAIPLDLHKAAQYAQKGQILAEKNGDKEYVITFEYQLGTIYYNLSDMDTSLVYFEKVIKSNTVAGTNLLGYALCTKGNIYTMKGLNAEALDILFQSMHIAENNEDKALLSTIYCSIAYLYATLNNYEQAKKYFFRSRLYIMKCDYVAAEFSALQALEIDNTDIYAKSNMYELILQANIMLGQKDRAMEYFEHYRDWIIEYSQQTFQASLSEMEVKYETEKKEMRIMAAAAKYNLTGVGKVFTIESAEKKCFDNAFNLIDESIRKMRSIAHHLMPETLGAYGLKHSIADFCRTIPHAKFTWFGAETRFDTKMEVMAYNTMHELMNNDLKHSGASNILVQVVKDPDRIALTVQDNGCGFDPSAQLEGVGLKNIRTRVAAYNGNLMIDSKMEVGTEVNVEIQL